MQLRILILVAISTFMMKTALGLDCSQPTVVIDGKNCWLYEGDVYKCCPLPNGVCCPEDYCCPEGSVCAGNHLCKRQAFSLASFGLIPATKLE